MTREVHGLFLKSNGRSEVDLTFRDLNDFERLRKLPSCFVSQPNKLRWLFYYFKFYPTVNYNQRKNHFFKYFCEIYSFYTGNNALSFKRFYYPLMGKILIINTLMASLFVYKMSVLPPMTKSQLKRLDKIITEFIWKNKRAKIPISLLRNPKKWGGLKLVNFETKQSALKIAWVKKIVNNEEFQYVHNVLIPGLGEKIWEINLSKQDAEKIVKETHTWKEVFVEWCTYHYSSSFVGREICKEFLWYNWNIRVNKQPMINNRCVNAGLHRFGDLLKEDGACKSYEQICREYNNCLNWYEFNQLKRAIPTTWWDIALNDSFDEIECRLNLEGIQRMTAVSREVYNIIIEKNAKEILYKSFIKYQQNIALSTTIDEYSKLFTRLYKISNETKLRDFQYRQLIFKIYANDTLVKWKILLNEECEFCKQPQNLRHLFWECEITNTLYHCVNTICDRNLNLSYETVFNCSVAENASYIGNFLILLTKQYIYRCKCQSIIPHKKLLAKAIIRQQSLEKYNANVEGTSKKFEKKWSNISEEGYKILWGVTATVED